MGFADRLKFYWEHGVYLPANPLSAEAMRRYRRMGGAITASAPAYEPQGWES